MPAYGKQVIQFNLHYGSKKPSKTPGFEPRDFRLDVEVYIH